MDSVLDDIDEAIGKLEEAKEKAPLGTGMMIDEFIGGLRNLRSRISNIIQQNER